MMFLKETTSPWSWKQMWPLVGLPNWVNGANFVAATLVFHSFEPLTYSTSFLPLMKCSHFSGVMMTCMVFHSPAGFVASILES